MGNIKWEINGLMCDSSHGLENCNLFNAKLLPKKSKFLFDKKLYYGCLFPIWQVRKSTLLLCMGMNQRVSV